MEGVKVYIPDPDHVWLPGVILRSNSDGTQLTVRFENVIGPKKPNEIQTLPPEEKLQQLLGTNRTLNLRDPQILKVLTAPTASTSNETSHADGLELSLPLQNEGASVASWKGYDDMITIGHLHEASILHNLRRRFFHHLPYTYTGKICIAVNPYQRLPLYDKATMAQYSDGQREDKPPHVYAISMEAFLNMRKGSDLLLSPTLSSSPYFKMNQSILVSGESGAGKTETTKILMSHLATLASTSNSKVIQQIIQANPLLESFGNAKTVRNDNSSRFGKFTELQFSPQGALLGARSRTYLLEKSRVTTQAVGERNFHIFYQLLLAKHQFPELELNTTSQFSYVGVDHNEAEDAHMEEARELMHTIGALDVIGINSGLQKQIFAVLAAILHLGETMFHAKDGDIDTSQVDKSSASHFAVACRLLNLERDVLEQALCHRNVVVGREVYLKPMRSDQAVDCRDALAKYLYSQLFGWLVTQINDTIGVDERRETAEKLSFIGILDIFGFEHFEHNSFEQFCINYANEKLQQKFVQDVLKTVQLEYDEENISWTHIQFADNQDVLNLIEGKLGVISFLNEESLLATGSDASFASKLGAVMQNNRLLETPRLNKCAFTIYHYAGKVTYDAMGFIDKHRDAILPDIKQCVYTSKLDILMKMREANDSDSSSGAAAPISRGRANSRTQRAVGRKKVNIQSKRTTVGTQFKESLSLLMAKIEKTNVHYVRCLKPNALKSASCFTHIEIVNQLRCAGVIEAIRVSRSAYPNRLLHCDCVTKFAFLALGKPKPKIVQTGVDEEEDEWKVQCEALMATLMPKRNIIDYQVGLTRVYFREGILERLEASRSMALKQYAIICQKVVRGYLIRKLFVRKKKCVIQIQTRYRCWTKRKAFLTFQRGLIACQARYRGNRARKHYKLMRLDHRIRKLQAICQGFIQRRRYLRKRNAVIKLQSFFRYSRMRMIFIAKIAKEKQRKALDNKVARLQLKLDQKHPKMPSTSPNSRPNSASPHRLAATNEETDMVSIVSSAHGSGSGSAGGNGSVGSRSSVLMGNNRYSTVSAGIFDESQDLITTLHETNETLRQQLEKAEEEIAKLKAENRTLKNLQQNTDVDMKVQKKLQREQESKDLNYLSALETEYERIRTYLCSNFELPAETGSLLPAIGAPVTSSSTSPALTALGGSLNGSLVNQNPDKNVLAQSSTNPNMNPHDQTQQLLLKSAARLAHAKTKISAKGSARRVKDYWEEIRNFPPPMQYTLGSVPWQRLLTDWSQGNPKKSDYMRRWLKNVLDGGPIVSDTFPMGVELKYVTPMMLDGFMQLIIPKLAERPDIQVHVHTKEFIGTSMRITLSEREGYTGSSYRPGMHSGYTSHNVSNSQPNAQNGTGRQGAMRVEDFQRISILANGPTDISRMSSNLSRISSTASTASTSESISSQRSSAYRSSRPSEGRGGSGNFYQPRGR